MILRKKIIALLASVSMIATTVVSLATTTASAAEVLPEVIATVTDTPLDEYANVGLVFTFANFEANVKVLTFHLSIPEGAKTSFEEDITGNTAIDLLKYGRRSNFKTGWTFAVTGNDLAANWLAGTGAGFPDTDTFELDFIIAKDLTASDFKVTGVEIGYTADSNALTQANGEVKVTDPTTSSEPDPTPTETIPTATEATPVSDGTLANWPANAATATAIGGTYVSDTDPSDTAVAYGVGLKGAGDDVTRTKVIWKVVANGETKGHEMILNTGIAGAGTAKVGLAIQGLTADEVTSVQAAFGN